MTSSHTIELAGDLDCNELQTLRDLLMMAPQESTEASAHVAGSSVPRDAHPQTLTKPKKSDAIKIQLSDLVAKRKHDLYKRMKEMRAKRKKRISDEYSSKQQGSTQDQTRQQSKLQETQREMNSNPITTCDVCRSTNHVKRRYGATICLACRSFYLRYRDVVFNQICIRGTGDCEIENLRNCSYCRWQVMLKFGLRAGPLKSTSSGKTSRYPTRSSRPLAKPKSEPYESYNVGTVPINEHSTTPISDLKTQNSHPRTPISQLETSVRGRSRKKSARFCLICQSPKNSHRQICNSCHVYRKYYKGKPTPECKTGLKNCKIYYQDKDKCRFCRIKLYDACLDNNSSARNDAVTNRQRMQISDSLCENNSVPIAPDRFVIELRNSESIPSSGTIPSRETSVQIPTNGLEESVTDKPKIDDLTGNFSSRFYGDLSDLRPGVIFHKSISDAVLPTAARVERFVKRSITTSRIDINPNFKLFTQEQAEIERERSPEPIDKIRTYSYDVNWKASRIIDDDDLIEEESETRTPTTVSSSPERTNKKGASRESESGKPILTITLKPRETTIDRRPMLCKKVKLMNSEDIAINRKTQSLIAPEEDCDSDIEVIEIDCDN